MSVFKCKMCGGTLEINQGDTVAVCEYCGTKQTLPKLDDEKRVQLYDRANYFRRQNEFDKAMGIFEMIIADEKDDAEAYWGIVLCKYGIEYVEDPRSHKRVPTVNRAQYTSIFDDNDYLSAIEHADEYQRDIYKEEAKVIDSIQKGILEISAKEEPFDVFICYKETDSKGKRTNDSVYAQDIYSALTKEGYKVFFARITLEDKLGSAYEPYIFAALHSAKVMLVIGTSKENFNAVWVKNEWSRFLAISKDDSSRAVIPCYKDISPYDMPEEFAYLQSQDMEKIGYIQDIVHGIEKYIKKEAVKETIVINGTNNSNISPLLKRAFMFLEDGDWQSADEYCEKALDIDPENAQAYLGKLLVELKIKKISELKKSGTNIDSKANYKKAVKFGDEEFRNELVSASEQNKENIYKDAIYLMEHARYESAVSKFIQVPRYKDSLSLSEECQTELQKIDNARKKLKSLRYTLSEKNKKLNNLNEIISNTSNNIISTSSAEYSLSVDEEKELKSFKISSIISLFFSLNLLILFIYIITSGESENLYVTIIGFYVMYIVLSFVSSILKTIGWSQLKKYKFIDAKKLALRIMFSIFCPITSCIIAFIDTVKARNFLKNKQRQNDLYILENNKKNTKHIIDDVAVQLNSLKKEIEENESYLKGIAEKMGDPSAFDNNYETLDTKSTEKLLEKAEEVVVKNQTAYTELLQKKLNIGYAQASRIIDDLEERGIIGPYEGSKPRKVLISQQQWAEMNGQANNNPTKNDETYKDMVKTTQLIPHNQ